MVFELAMERLVSAAGSIPETRVSLPLPGQFFMLRAKPSSVFLGRPISVYFSDDKTITFLVLKKGKGTAELCSLREGDAVDIIGPIGNCFAPPDELVSSLALRAEPRVAVIGGGIGVAPVIGFALALKERSFDFYASFRSSPYGIDRVAKRAERVIVTTEDGSAGIKGMLPAVFNPSAYDLVYACGPTAMLSYVQRACAQSGSALVFLSLEQRMACGAGACLGCTVRTINGNRRCCVDGPVFDASEVIL